MNRLQRHAICGALFFVLLIIGGFSRIMLLDVARNYDDERQEESEEAFDYSYSAKNQSIFNNFRNRKILDRYRDQKTLPSWGNVVDDRTLTSPDFYAPLDVRVVAGSNTTRAQRYADMRIRMEREDILKREKKTNIIDVRTTNVVDEKLLLETDSVQRVPRLVEKTPKGGTTHVKPRDVYAINKKKIGSYKFRFYTEPRSPAKEAPRHGWRKFFIAINLFDNSKVIPFFTGALVAFIEDEIAPFFDVSTSVVVSIYANASPDLTSPMIRTVLIPSLQRAGVEVIYATVKGSCQGYVERNHRLHERIEWMACVRNKALEPFYEHGMGVFSGSQGAPSNDTVSNDDGESAVVLFVNDVFFRPKDVTTLLESVEEPLMSSRLDPDGTVTSDVSAEELTVDSEKQTKDRGSIGTETAGSSGGTTFDMACGMDFYYLFYDTWVSRDRKGNAFLAQMPYSDEPETRDAFDRIIGGASAASSSETRRHAVPVKCCWNGMAAIRGSLFLPPPPSRRVNFPTPNETQPAEDEEQQEEEEEYESKGAAAPPHTITSPAGTLYDLIPRHTAHHELSEYYTRVLARRLIQDTNGWWSAQKIKADALGRPVPVEARPPDPLMRTVAAHIRTRQGNTRDLLRYFVSTVNDTSYEEVENTWRRVKPEAIARAIEESYSNPTRTPLTLPLTEHVVNDATFYRARYPAIRFRHSFVPSYGARVAAAPRAGAVRDDVCLSSECLLICEDIMHATLLQRGRTPVMLMNPNVRVAYESDHFDRITASWFYTSPFAFRLMGRLRTWELWRSTMQDIAACPPTQWVPALRRWWRGAPHIPVEFDRDSPSPADTSAGDDWIHDESSVMRVVVPSSSAVRYVSIDVMQFTSMACFYPKSSHAVFGWLLWFPRVIAILCLLVWLYRDVSQNIEAKCGVVRGDWNMSETIKDEDGIDGVVRAQMLPSLTPEERCWHKMDQYVRGFWYALRNSLCASKRSSHAPGGFCARLALWARRLFTRKQERSASPAWRRGEQGGGGFDVAVGMREPSVKIASPNAVVEHHRRIQSPILPYERMRSRKEQSFNMD